MMMASLTKEILTRANVFTFHNLFYLAIHLSLILKSFLTTLLIQIGRKLEGRVKNLEIIFRYLCFLLGLVVCLLFLYKAYVNFVCMLTFLVFSSQNK